MKDLRRFLSYFRSRPRDWVLGFGTMVLSTVFFLAMPSLVRRAIDGLQSEVTLRRLFELSGVIVLLAAGDAVCLFYTRRILIGASRHMEYEIRQDLFSHLLRLPPSWYRGSRTGDVMSRAVNDLAAVRMLLGPGVMQAANSAMVGSVAVVLMFRVSPLLTFVALALFPAVAIATKVIGQKIHRRFTEIQEFFGEISSSAQENFSGVRVVRAFAREEAEEGRCAA